MDGDKFMATMVRHNTEQEKRKARINLASMALKFGWSLEDLKTFFDVLGL